MNNKICIDFGGGNLKIYHNHFGLVFNQPSLIAVEKRGKKYSIIATGTEAENLISQKQSNQIVFSPITEAIVQSVEYAGAYLRRAINQSIEKYGTKNASVLINVPSGLNITQKSDFIKLCNLAGLKNVDIADSTVSALCGSVELTPEDEVLVIELGASKCDFQILNNFKTKLSATLGLGGNSLKNAITQMLWEDDMFWVTDQDAKNIQQQLCSLLQNNNHRIEVNGISYKTSEDALKSLSAEQFFPLTKGFFDEVILVAKTLVKTYQNSSSSTIHNILLCGGLAKTVGLEKYFIKHFPNAKIIITEDPENAGLRGLAKLLA